MASHKYKKAEITLTPCRLVPILFYGAHSILSVLAGKLLDHICHFATVVRSISFTSLSAKEKHLNGISSILSKIYLDIL